MKNKKLINGKMKVKSVKEKNKKIKLLNIKHNQKGDLKMIKISFVVIILLTSFSAGINSQVTHEWTARYTGAGAVGEESKSIAVDASGNVYVTGHVSVYGTDYDYGTIKYNSAGVQLWLAIYDGPANFWDWARDIAVDDLGNVYVTGYSNGNSTALDIATIKYNSSGIQQWASRYDGPGNMNDYGQSIKVDGLGNVYVTGYSFGSVSDYDYVTVKYNSIGVQQWASRYNGPGNFRDEANSIEVDGSGNVYVTGKSSLTGINYDYATIKYNSSGVQQWVSGYNGPGNDADEAYSLAVDGSGNVYVTGASWGSGIGWDYATIMYNPSGVQQWVSRYNGPGNNFDKASSIARDGSGNIYVTGYSWGGSGPSDDYTTIKYNSSGVQQWVTRYNGPGNSSDFANSIALDGSGNVYVSGESYGIGTLTDYATIKYNSSGVQQWAARYNGPGNSSDAANSIAVDASGNVYVTGYSEGSGSSWDYATIKYSQTVGIQPISNEIPKDFSLSQNYPNPFNPKTKIRFSLPNPSEGGAMNAQLVIYDILGREAATLVNQELQPGTYEISWDASDFPSGIYFYTLQAESFIHTKKIILVK